MGFHRHWLPQLLDKQFDALTREDAESFDLDDSADWRECISGPNKTPLDLNDYTEYVELKFKDGSTRRVVRQKAAR